LEVNAMKPIQRIPMLWMEKISPNRGTHSLLLYIQSCELIETEIGKRDTNEEKEPIDERT